jgi:phospholipid-transporting ATPase
MRNTDSLYGICVYSGHHTKVMMNSARPRNKISDLERLMNRSILIILATQFCLSLIGAIVGTAIAASPSISSIDFLEGGSAGVKRTTFETFVALTGSWILMLTNFVPISLLVQLEMVKYWQGSFMSLEHLMYDEEQEREMKCQSSNLNEQLGQVEYVFSDKTGTLTCNIMEFRKFTAGNVAYGTDQDGGPGQESNVNFFDPNLQTVQRDPKNPGHEALKKLVLHLALCHTIIIDDRKGTYNAASPDELALVNAAKQFGYEFKGTDRDDNMVVLEKATGQELKYKLLNTLEFSSARKRMSVIVREPKGRLLLICKGADSIIAERLAHSSLESSLFAETQKHVDAYATQGLRTLYMAERYLEEQEYAQWNQQAEEANLLLQGREERIEEVNERIEWEL